MPIYEFQCSECSKSFEKLCSMRDDLNEISCVHCQSKNVKKKISSFATSGSRNNQDSGETGSSSSCSTCSSGSCASCHH